MKRIGILCVALSTLLLLLTACAEVEKPGLPPVEVKPVLTIPSFETPPCPEVAETVIVDSDSLTVTVTGMEYDSLYKTYVVKTKILNHGQKTISYYLNRANVNGYTISALLVGDVYGGMAANADFGLPRDEIQLAGIKAIQEIEFEIILRFREDDELICTASANLKTTDYGTYEDDYSFNGTEVYVTEDYRVLLAPSKTPSVSKPLTVYVENKTNHPIMLMYDSIAINNQMVMEFMSGAYVLPFSHRIENIFITYFGEKPEIDSIESVTLGIQILPYDSDGSFSTADLITTPTVTVDFNEQ